MWETEEENDNGYAASFPINKENTNFSPLEWVLQSKGLKDK